MPSNLFLGSLSEDVTWDTHLRFIHFQGYFRSEK